MTRYQEKIKIWLNQNSCLDWLETDEGLIEEWLDFVEQCEGGYGYTLSEYSDEIEIRLVIKELMNSEINEFEEFKTFRSEIEKIDDRFKTILLKISELSHKSNWWETGLPKLGGEQFAENVYERYKVKLQSSHSS